MPWHELVELLSIGGPNPGFSPRYNIAPTQDVLTLIAGDGDDALRGGLLRWGFQPSWSKRPLINARCEDAAGKRTWARPFAARRCLVPADGFYEWKRQGNARTPYDFAPVGEPVVTFAAVWDRFELDGGRVGCVSILTRAAGPEVAGIHDREPAVIAAEHRAAWLDPALRDPADLMPLLARPAGPLFEARPISPRINSARHEGTEVLEYIQDSDGPGP
ncbi:MAG: SOS response-associated peptidase [Alphaproteobacteria bacterium]|nr:SOS response-associated peptidase [Alphaproteobacteria bacterium]